MRNEIMEALYCRILCRIIYISYDMKFQNNVFNDLYSCLWKQSNIWRHNIWWARYEMFLNLQTEFDHAILDANFQEFAD